MYFWLFKVESTQIGYSLHQNGHPILSFPRIYLNFVLCSFVLIELDGCYAYLHVTSCGICNFVTAYFMKVKTLKIRLTHLLSIALMLSGDVLNCDFLHFGFSKCNSYIIAGNIMQKDYAEISRFLVLKSLTEKRIRRLELFILR